MNTISMRKHILTLWISQMFRAEKLILYKRYKNDVMKFWNFFDPSPIVTRFFFTKALVLSSQNHWLPPPTTVTVSKRYCKVWPRIRNSNFIKYVTPLGGRCSMILWRWTFKSLKIYKIKVWKGRMGIKISSYAWRPLWYARSVFSNLFWFAAPLFSIEDNLRHL